MNFAANLWFSTAGNYAGAPASKRGAILLLCAVGWAGLHVKNFKMNQSVIFYSKYYTARGMGKYEQQELPCRDVFGDREIYVLLYGLRQRHRTGQIHGETRGALCGGTRISERIFFELFSRVCRLKTHNKKNCGAGIEADAPYMFVGCLASPATTHS